MDPEGREALGRSRGGLTSKVHLLADDGCRPLVWLTSPGQRGDSPMFIPLMQALNVARTGAGRPRTRPCANAVSKQRLPSRTTSARSAADAAGPAAGRRLSTASSTADATQSNAASGS